MEGRDIHVPVVAKSRDAWGVYCLGCSERAQDFVYPCELPDSTVWSDWPPAQLWELPAVT